MIWLGLGLSITLLLVVAQRNLYLAMFAAAIVLGLTTLPISSFFHEVYLTFTDPSIVALALVVAIIAMIGGILEESGGMEDLVSNMRIGKRPFLGASPALLGMLPMPGGALLSAPMVERSGAELQGSTKAALNVWFRHILFFVYPLAPPLIASAKIAGLEVYSVLPYLLPFFLFSLLVGYFFFLRETTEGINYEGAFSLRGLLIPLSIILSAPLIDFVLKTVVNPEVSELATLAGVVVSVLAAWVVSGFDFSELREVGIKMQPWNFSLIILGMFTFLHVFQASGAPEVLAKVDVPMSGILIGVAFILGVITGRIQAPASVVIPIFFARTGQMSMPYLAFAVTYFSIFLGYAVSPIHPCVSISVEYFESSVKNYIRKLAIPTVLSLALATGGYILFV